MASSLSFDRILSDAVRCGPAVCSRFLVLLLLLLGPASPATAQNVTVGDPLEDYARLLHLTGTLRAASSNVRPLSMEQLFEGLEPGARHPWRRVLSQYRGAPARGGVRAGVLDPQVNTFWNSARPFGMNDGAVWQGRGRTFAVSSGVFARYGILSAALRPRLIFTENRDFDLSRLPVHSRQSIYARPLRTDLDMPQRFGRDAFTIYDWGQSYVRVDYRGAAVGFSNENMWWGPGLRNAIIMTNNAPGFPHVFIGTSAPAYIWAGHLHGRWFWGNLEHSEYFVDVSSRQVRDAAGDRRLLTGVVVDFEPRWVPGLYLGAAQTLMLHSRLERQFVRDYLGVINPPFFQRSDERPRGTDDKMLSFFARWVFPQSGFELYGEWARGDHTSSVRDAFVTPDHARAYTVGFQKAFVASQHLQVRLNAEYTTLEAPMETGFRDTAKLGGSYFYSHEGIKQGYTHRGQVIGAGIGPGSNSQFIGVDVFAPWGRAGIFGLRQAIDNDRHYTFLAGLPDPLMWWLYEVNVGGGVNFGTFFRGFELEGGVTYTRFLNHDYIFKNDLTNINMTFSVRRSIMGYR